MTAIALSSYLAPVAIYSFPTIIGSCCVVHGATYYFWQWPWPHASHQDAQRFHSNYLFQFAFACIVCFVQSNSSRFQLCRSNLFPTSGLSPPAKYLCKVYIEENTWIHVSRPSCIRCEGLRVFNFIFGLLWVVHMVGCGW